MKFVHLSDLHLGKRVNGFSMLEDQQYILKKILQIIDEEKPDAVLIAGDVYDKPIPPAEAVQMLDDFLSRLVSRKLQVCMISGNHDSAERIAFGGRIMAGVGIHLSPVYHGDVTPVILEDSYGPVSIYMLPFVKPAHVRRYRTKAVPETATETTNEAETETTAAEIVTYTDAIREAVAQMQLDPQARNILVTHQFVTGASRSDSEEVSVGGSDNVDASVFDAFDYVALGHIHGPQSIGRETVRYCGTPLKYSFSECKHKKSVTVVEMQEKGSVSVRTVPLEPKLEWREIRGSYMDVTAKSSYEGTNREDYVHITLTDEEDIYDAIGRLRVIYPNLMKLDYDNRRTRQNTDISGAVDVEKKTPLELFGEFYEKQNNQPMSEGQTDYMQKLIETIWEEQV